MTRLSKIRCPGDLKELTVDELCTLAGEIREYIIETIPMIGGHFASEVQHH